MIEFLTKIGTCLFETTYTRFNLTGGEMIIMAIGIAWVLSCTFSKKVRNIFF